MKLVQFGVLPVVVGICVVVAAAQLSEKKSASSPVKQSAQHLTQSQARTLKLPGPDVQNLMLGTWSIKVKYEPSEKMPNGGVGDGKEVWRPGPGGRSVIEELHEKNTSGELDGLAVAWWDEKEHGQRFVWCDNNEPQGCYVSKSVAKWEGNRLVWSEEVEENGKKVTKQEIFSDITPTSFLQVIQEGPAGGELKPVATIRATRLSETTKKSKSRPAS